MKPTRRKYATREKIAVLQKWVKDHNGNLRPLTPEKEVLAVLAGMTLPHVHNWFANARRRLKQKLSPTVTTTESSPVNEISTTRLCNPEASVLSSYTHQYFDVVNVPMYSEFSVSYDFSNKQPTR